jgi:Fe-S-cluster containining protein
MTPEHQNQPDSGTARVELSGQEWQLQATMTVPAGPTHLRQILPMVQELTNKVVDVAAHAAEQDGERVSCKKGCGACCRQLVPIAEVEARGISELVEKMPEPRRTAIRARFAEARRRLESSGVLTKLLEHNEWSDGDGRAIGLQYFSQGIPCPFLEEESCSIHPVRPIACREYLVTSPAENCSRPSADTVKMVPVPLKVWTALARFDEPSPGARFIRWVPLILALEWAETHPEEPPPRPGPDLLRQLFEHLKGSANARQALAEVPGVEPAAAAEPVKS